MREGDPAAKPARKTAVPEMNPQKKTVTQSLPAVFGNKATGNQLVFPDTSFTEWPKHSTSGGNRAVSVCQRRRNDFVMGNKLVECATSLKARALGPHYNRRNSIDSCPKEAWNNLSMLL